MITVCHFIISFNAYTDILMYTLTECLLAHKLYKDSQNGRHNKHCNYANVCSGKGGPCTYMHKHKRKHIHVIIVYTIT